MTIRRTKLDTYEDVNRMRKSLQLFGLHLSYKKIRNRHTMSHYDVIISDEKITNEIKKQYLG